MVDPTRNSYAPPDVSPPGETLRELLEERALSQAELAERMGRPKKTISEIINAKAALTPETALELELVLGVSADFWNARERNYRSALARAEQLARLAADVTWAKAFPLRVLRQRGWLPESRDPAEIVRSVLEYFGVASRSQWEALATSAGVSYRKSAAFEVDKFALSAWLRRGEIEAQSVRTSPYDAAEFRRALSDARQLTRESPAAFVERVSALCAKAGVVVRFVPALPASRVSGAARWLAPHRALIQLSHRYKTDDHLYFTFFHEAAHLLLHGKREVFLDTAEAEGRDEEEANAWAADFLIPRDDLTAFVVQGDLRAESLVRFAEQLGIAVGIVVGRLQHERVVPFSRFNPLKRSVRWAGAVQ